MSKAQNIIYVRVPDDVVHGGKVAREMPCHGHVICCVVSHDAEKLFLEVIFIKRLINFGGKEGTGVGAGEVDE